ncbi:MAG: helix-turn-helix domain-containing protein [Kutzneria sp.]|nr:helix-turn-helix domain-containing protein [Kutzneria sp.]
MRDELKAVVDGLAALLHRAVAIDDPQMRLLAYTAHDEKVDEYRIASVMKLKPPRDVIEHALDCGIATAQGPVRVPGLPERGLLGRVAVPVRCEGHLFGYLWLLDDDETLTGIELQMATDAAAAAGHLIHRERLIGDLRKSRDRELVRDLLSEEEPVRAHAARGLTAEDRLPNQGQFVCVAVRLGDDVMDRHQVADTELDLVLKRAMGRLAPGAASVAMARAGGRGTLLAAAPTLPPAQRLRDHGEWIRAQLCKTLATDDVWVGIGPTVVDLLDAYKSHRGAENAIRVSRAVPGFGAVVCYDELGMYRLLLHVDVAELADEAVPAGLRRLIENDTTGDLVKTLETYLDAAGDVRSVVDRLNVHRTSVYHRLARIEKATGLSLSNGGERLSLHVGIKLARLNGMVPAIGP